MALDQAIMESTSASVVAGKPTPVTLRFYGWSRPTLSLGYFQSHRLADSAAGFGTLRRA